MKHILYQTGDQDAPDVIKDGNGEVVLGLCRVCGRAEVELDEPCTPWRPIDTVPMLQQVLLCHNKQGNAWIAIGVIYPKSGPGCATHWMPVPALPPNPGHQRRASVRCMPLLGGNSLPREN